MAPAPIDVEDENEDGLSETQLINEVCPHANIMDVADMIGVQDLEEEVSPRLSSLARPCRCTELTR
jgi:hypothetical protein